MAIKISKRTLAIIENYNTINTGLLIEANDKALRVMKETKSVISTSTIDEEIPNNVAIYNVSEFLRCVSLFKSPMFEFDKTHVIISEEDGSNDIRYGYSDASLITAMPKKNINMPACVSEFIVTSDHLQQISKGANTLGLGDLIIRGGDGKIVLEVRNKDNAESNVYRVTVQEEYDGTEFEAHFLMENLKLIKGSYKVGISQKISNWILETEEENELVYYVALEKTSKV